MLTILSYVGTAILGAVVGYLVLRNNPKYKARADAFADAEAAKLKNRSGS